MSSEPSIEVSGLVRSYGRSRVLDGVDLSVERGTVAALLGPNGAGKTTLVRILSTLLRPHGGRATVDGHDVVRQPSRVRAAIGSPGSPPPWTSCSPERRTS